MRQIRYNFATNIIRFEFPIEWDGEDISGVTLAITDRDGNALLAAQSLTLYTATTLNAAATRFSSEIVLAAGASALEKGDPILIEGDVGFERNRVKGYDSGTRMVKLESDLNNAHEAGDAVRGLWGYYTLDTTTVATWTAGLVCVLTWTPTGAGLPITQMAQISKSIVELEGLEKSFSRRFPRAYSAFTESVDRFKDMTEEAKGDVADDMELDRMTFNRVVDQSVVKKAVMYKMRQLWADDGDEKMKDEQELAAKQYADKLAIAKQRVVWEDHNQDLVEDDGETTDHDHHFGKAW